MTPSRKQIPSDELSQCANMVWKKLAQTEISVDQVQAAALDLEVVNIEIVPTQPLLAQAFALAGVVNHPACDCFNLAVAIDLDCFLGPAGECARSHYEGQLQQLCIKEDLGVIPYYALGAGFLTGKYRKESDIKGRARTDTIERFFNPHGLAILSAMDKIAARLNASVAQIALAWVLTQPGITAPIVSATSLTQLDEILGAAEIALDADALDVLDKASA